MLQVSSMFFCEECIEANNKLITGKYVKYVLDMQLTSQLS